MVTLPDGVDACDIGTITVWCEPFTAIFSRLEVSRSVFVSIEGWGPRGGGGGGGGTKSLQRACS